MQIHFRAKPWDIFLCWAYTLGLTGFYVATGSGHPLGLLLVFFVPGYMSTAAVYPSHEEIGWGERLVLSLGLSLAIVPSLGLINYLLGIDVGLLSVGLEVTAFSLVSGVVAYVRRVRLPVEKRLSGTLEFSWPFGREYSARDKVVTILLALSVLVSFGALLYLLTTPQPIERFTEFYILGPGNNTTGYPTRLRTTDQGAVNIGVVNHEYTTVNYTIRVDLVGIGIVHDNSTGQNETLELNLTTWSMFNFSLADGSRWTSPYTFSIPSAGLWKVQFLLFREEIPSASYLALHLYVVVS